MINQGKTKTVWGIGAAILTAIIIIIYFVLGRGISRSSREEQLKGLNVILITIDTLRADYLSCYKKGTAHTPHLDRLAAEGVLFERCIAQTPFTLPSHTTILSGTYPLYHRVRDNGGFRVPGQLEFVSEVLQDNGFSTSAFIAAYVLHSKWGINQGFDTFSDDFDLSKYRSMGAELEKRAEVVLKDAEKWIQEHKEKKFFTWIHLFDPHAEYEPPPPYDRKYPDNPYAGEVEYTDEQLGLFFKFLQEQGLYDKSLIIVTSDHGEGLWEHGERTHGFFVYETTVWVPLIIRAPGEFSQKRIHQVVELVDIAPTILDAFDTRVPKSYQGDSLLPLMYPSGKEPFKKDAAYTEAFYSRLHLGWSELQALYHKDWKYIRAPKEELYNIRDDGAEKNNIAVKYPVEKEKIKRRLLKFISEKSRNAISQVQTMTLDQKDRERLESLGYITSKPVSDPSKKGPLPDPKDKVSFFEIFDGGRKLMSEGKHDQAIQLAKKLLEDEPGNLDVLMMLGVSSSKNGFPAEAVPYLYKVLKAKPDYNDAMVNLLQALIADGKPDQAILEAHRFLKIFPKDYVLYILLGRAFFYKTDYENSLKHFQKSLEIEPLNSKALLYTGEVYLLKKDYTSAESYIKKARAIYPNLENAYYLLGKLEETRGNTEAALTHYERELENNPENHIASFHLAETLKKKGEYQRAIDYYYRTIKGDPSFKLPYLMIADYYFKTGQYLDKAIALCNKGIQIKPEDEMTLFGYFILTNIYAKQGDRANLRFYSQKGEELHQRLQQNKGGSR